MGLDQWARTTGEREFQWRSHWKLHEFFEKKWLESRLKSAKKSVMAQAGTGEDFNSQHYLIKESDIDELLKLLEKGKIGNDDNIKYMEQDLKFCKWAKKIIKEGKKIYYYAWF